MATVSLRDRLLRILIDGHVITGEQLEHALSIQKEHGGRLSEILAAEGYVTESDLMVTLSEHLGIPPINLAKINIRPDLPDISNSLRLLRDGMEAAATGGAAQ